MENIAYYFPHQIMIGTVELFCSSDCSDSLPQRYYAVLRTATGQCAYSDFSWRI